MDLDLISLGKLHPDRRFPKIEVTLITHLSLVKENDSRPIFGQGWELWLGFSRSFEENQEDH